MKIKKLIGFSIAAAEGLSSMLVIAGTAITHQMKPVGKTAVMIHADPKDHPLAGKPTAVWFMLMQNDRHLPTTDCNCQVIVYNAQHKVVARPGISAVKEEGQPAAKSIVTFPDKGAYTVEIKGTSKTKKFQPFDLSFPFSVGTTQANSGY